MARLAFPLPGTWLAIDPRDEEASFDRVDAAVRDVAGVADDAAAARRRLRDQLRTVVGSARASGAQGVFLCLEVAPGVRLPATLTVHAPSAMSMTPAIGTASAAVLDTLHRGLQTLEVAGIDTAVRVPAPDGGALRIHRRVDETVEGAPVEAPVQRLEVDYWFAVPGSKRVVLASFAAPLGHLHDATLNLFDSIAAAARFESAAASLAP
ncbi:hypothetical protein [Microbacterium sp. 77mftsu3.1]|uniref:hypothetical protein n=1 Tax=Microbacterium sp. 77mftsu3.1 TaxID=1761802 RepID=UPI00037D6CE7|nr:hypothetical protein [Microbacterium sp. 77mftsu3.1]SDH23705.1 hypothetical protein SAMN04488590_2972 [Microbacterium sp. 77mftsu3.1]